MRGTKRAGALVAAGLLLGAADARAAELTIGSDLSAPATVAYSDPNDILWWPSAQPGGTIDVPVKGQAIIMRLKGGTQQPRGGSSNPNYDMMHFVVLRPKGDGTWRVTASSVDLKAPVIGRNGVDENTVTEYTSAYPLCVQPGDRIGLASVGGFDAQLFPNGLPYQTFAQKPDFVTDEFRAGGMIELDKTVVKPARVPRAELLLQVVVGTEDSARAACGGTSGQTDPGNGPRPEPPPPPGTARPFVKKPPHAPWLYDRRKVKLDIRCSDAADCKGTVTLRARGERIARRAYDLDAGESGSIVLRINKAGKRMAKPGRKLRTRAVIEAGGQTMSRAIAIRVPRSG